MEWRGSPLGWEKNQDPSSTPEQGWQDGAGGLLLVAAVHETGLLTHFESAIASCLTQTSHPQLSPSSRSQRSVLLTLLFLNAVGLRRTRDEASLHRRGPWLVDRKAESVWLLAYRALFHSPRQC